MEILPAVKTLKNEAKVIAEDKKTAALHEAGHAIVALRLGAESALLTIKFDKDADLMVSTAFRATCLAPMGDNLLAAARSYAGILAERMWLHPGDNAEDLWELITGVHLMSRTDMNGVERLHPRSRHRAMMLSYNTLKANWAAVIGVAYSLHETKRGRLEVGIEQLRRMEKLGSRVLASKWPAFVRNSFLIE